MVTKPIKPHEFDLYLQKTDLWEVFKDSNVRTKGAILNSGVSSLEELCKLTHKYLRTVIPNCGRRTANDIQHTLAEHGRYL